MMFWTYDSFSELPLTTYMPLKDELYLERYITYESAFEPHSKQELPESRNVVIQVCSTHWSGEKNTHLKTLDALDVKTKIMLT